MKIRMPESSFFVLMTSAGEIIGQGTDGDFGHEFASDGRIYWLITGNRNEAILESFFAEYSEIYCKKVIMDGVSDISFSRKKIESGCFFFGVPKPVTEKFLSFAHL